MLFTFSWGEIENKSYLFSERNDEYFNYMTTFLFLYYLKKRFKDKTLNVMKEKYLALFLSVGARIIIEIMWSDPEKGFLI